MGTVVTLDVGPNCGEIRFRFAYRTATDVSDDAGNSGILFVRHLTSAREVSVNVTPSTSLDTVEVSLRFDAVSNWPSGPQAFFVSFQSSVFPNVIGVANVQDGVGNQLSVLPTFDAPYSAGEVYWILTFDKGDAKYWVEPDALGSYTYQVGWVSADSEGGAQTWIIWPNLDDSPAIVTSVSGGNNPTAVVRELGAFGLVSISYEVTAGQARNIRQLAHAPAVSLNSLSLDQSLAVLDIMPDVSANATENRLGYRLQTDEDISGLVAFQSVVQGRISITFRAVRLSDDGADADWTLDVFKPNGDPITPSVKLERALIPRFSNQYELAAGATTMRVLQGARRAARSWGMRDSMPLTDCLKGSPLLIETADFVMPSVANAGGVAIFRLYASSGEFYLYGFNARFM
jgi:hypothetical protein